jgi:hypothetical protein
MKGRIIALDRLATGTGRLAAQFRAWASGKDLQRAERVRGVLGRTIGGGLSTAFVAGTVWALSRGVLMWGSCSLALVSAWVAGGRQHAEDTPEEPALDPGAFLELVHDVARGANVHLVTIREQLAAETERPWTPAEVRALCDAAGIRVRDGVRVPGAKPAVTTGIHRDDLPPLPRPLSDAPGSDVAAGHDANNNTNITTEVIGEGAGLINRHGPSIRQEARR